MDRTINVSVGVVAAASTALSTAIVWVFAVALVMDQNDAMGLALAAGMIDILGLLCLVLLVGRVLRNAHYDAPIGKSDKAINIVNVVIAGIAALLTLALLLWLQLRPVADLQVIGDHFSAFKGAEFALWIVSVLGSAAFFSINLAKQSSRGRRQPATMEETLEKLPETREVMQPKTLHCFRGAVHYQSPPSSPCFSSFSSESKMSCVSVRPLATLAQSSSMTALIPNAAPLPETRCIPFPAPDLTQYKHFGSDATSRPSKLGRPVLTVATTATKLEPIPGSRPNSWAGMLNPPFPQKSTPGMSLQRHSAAARSHSVCAHSLEVPKTENPKAFRRRSRSVPSINSNESHIHPLFRTDSPLPPPTPTTGTSVVASAFGGQTMSAKSITRATSQSYLASASQAGGLLTANEAQSSCEHASAMAKEIHV